MSKFDLNVWVTEEFQRGWTHVVKGNFADPQLITQAATDIFCYNQNTGIGAFFATVKNGLLDDGTPVPDGPLTLGEIIPLTGNGHTLCQSRPRAFYSFTMPALELPISMGLTEAAA